jgi:hypothetical protein
MMSVFIPHVFDDVKFEKIAHTFESWTGSGEQSWVDSQD